MRLVRAWFPVVLWSALILSASTDSFSSGQSNGWMTWLVGREMPSELNVVIRKLGHIVAYAILGILAWRADRRTAVAILVALFVATTDEWRQSLTVTRTGSPWDVLLDVVGGWLGVAVAKRMWQSRNAQSKIQNPKSKIA